MRLADWLGAAARQLTAAGVDSPRLSAEMLAQCVLRPHAAGESARLCCLLEAHREISAAEGARLDALLERRAGGQPVAQLTGHREFYGRDFLVTAHTLIPRPETELLVDVALERLPAGPLSFADLGAGTGCLGLTLAAERPAWHGLSLELDGRALAVCAANRERLGLRGRVGLARGDMFHPPLRPASLDMLVANPPYIAEAERPQVMDEVLRFEPAAALFSGSNGLAHLEAAVRAAALALRPGGRVLLEHGAAQGAAVRRLLVRAGAFTALETLADLAGLPRCATALRA